MADSKSRNYPLERVRNIRTSQNLLNEIVANFFENLAFLLRKNVGIIAQEVKNG